MYPLVLLILISLRFLITTCSAAPMETINNAPTIKVLSIDGGGVRGIIPALILEEIEKRLGNQSIAESFDTIVGTSTGGIIALMLNVPGETGRPRYTAKEIADLYRDLSIKIFKQSSIRYLTSLNGWISPRYSEQPLTKLLKQYLGDTRLSESYSHVIIPAYDLELNDTVFFTTDTARKQEERNFYMRDLARATSAAPTYFSPFKLFEHTDDNPKSHVLIDGGVTINNPSMSAYIFALSRYSAATSKFLFISLGTGTTQGSHCKSYSYNQFKGAGKLRWAQPIINITMDGVKSLTHGQMEFIEKYHSYLHGPTKDQSYIRLDIDIDPRYEHMDNPSNIPYLEQYAQKLIENSEQEIQFIVEVLKK